MKGVELPINTLIIIVVGVTVLLAAIAIFFGTYNPTRNETNLETATSLTCKKISPALCKDPGKVARMPVFDFDTNGNGKMNEHAFTAIGECVKCDQDTFEALCNRYYGGPAPCSDPWNEQGFIDLCMVKICGCPKFNYPSDYVHNTCP